RPCSRLRLASGLGGVGYFLGGARALSALAVARNDESDPEMGGCRGIWKRELLSSDQRRRLTGTALISDALRHAVGRCRPTGAVDARCGNCCASDPCG